MPVEVDLENWSRSGQKAAQPDNKGGRSDTSLPSLVSSEVPAHKRVGGQERVRYSLISGSVTGSTSDFR